MPAETRFPVRIEKLAIGGAGVARHDGLVIFVDQAAPGDEVLIEITKAKKNFAEARIVQILKPAPSRRTPPCPVANECGGCNWQHIDESEQLRQKELLVRESLQKFLRDRDFNYLPIQPSPRSLRYRNRIQPKIANGRFGFFARGSYRIVETSDCLITEEPLAQQMPRVREWALQQRDQGRLEMYLTEKDEIRYGFVEDEDDGVGFSQVNRFQNEDLVRTALDWSSGKYRHIYDLYSGAGNFSFPLAQLHQVPLTAVELNPKLVARGREQKHPDIEFVHSDVEKYLIKAAVSSQGLVILDPPRAGCSEAIMKRLADIQPQKIIYISCHPVSLARDLKWFFDWSKKLGKERLQLRRVQAFEMFPQTDHVETIAELGVDS